MWAKCSSAFLNINHTIIFLSQLYRLFIYTFKLYTLSQKTVRIYWTAQKRSELTELPAGWYGLSKPEHDNKISQEWNLPDIGCRDTVIETPILKLIPKNTFFVFAFKLMYNYN